MHPTSSSELSGAATTSQLPATVSVSTQPSAPTGKTLLEISVTVDSRYTEYCTSVGKFLFDRNEIGYYNVDICFLLKIMF